MNRSQINSISFYYLTKRESAIKWVNSESQEYLSNERLDKVLNDCEDDPELCEFISKRFAERHLEFPVVIRAAVIKKKEIKAIKKERINQEIKAGRNMMLASIKEYEKALKKIIKKSKTS